MVSGKQLGAALVLVAAFSVGAITGRTSTAWWRSNRGPSPGQREGGERRPPGGRFVATLERELKLTPTQRDSVQAIVKAYDPKMRAVYDGMRPKFDSLRAQVHADIMKVLTDDQKAAFQRWSARMDSVARNRSKEGQRGR
jgi:Spy/CpxP family protein refolding chaperone